MAETAGIGTPPPGAGTVGPSGGAVFAGLALLIVGTLDALWGLAAVLNDKVVSVGGGGVIVLDFAAWAGPT